jgi:hypothetical protein
MVGLRIGSLCFTLHNNKPIRPVGQRRNLRKNQ